MDSLIKRFDAEASGDLKICYARGVAYQFDMSKPIQYADAYWRHYEDLEGSPIAKKLNKARVDLVNRFAGAKVNVLDVGIGSGEFIKSRPNTFGIDVNKRAIMWLARQGKLKEALEDFTAFTFWDVLEHVPEPDMYFRRMSDDCYLFTSLPTFADLNFRVIRDSKHYKPNEHFYYWSEHGFIDWMAAYRFRLLEKNNLEVEAGREGITSFAFKRDLPGYHSTIDQYTKLYEPNYGASAYLYLDIIADQVRHLNPGNILDYGCGRSDLAAHFWNDGKRKIVKYDPAIPQFKQMPDDKFDLVICCDVMEHILLPDIDRVLGEIKAKAASGKALFTISTKPARARLPDGRNAHVSLLTESEWLRWIDSVFGRAHLIPTHDDKIIMVKTY